MSKSNANSSRLLKKQEREMAEILSIAWSWNNVESFEEVTLSSLPGLKPPEPSPSISTLSSTATRTTMDLRTVANNLYRNNVYSSTGKAGWEMFAADIGFVYNQFIICDKEIQLAREHLAKVCLLLSQIDKSLGEIAKKSSLKNTSNIILANTKSNRPSDIFPHKRKVNSNTGIHPNSETKASKRQSLGENLPHYSSPANTTSVELGSPMNGIQLQEKAKRKMEQLKSYIIELGGNEQLLSSFRCEVKKRIKTDHYDAIFIDAKNNRFRSMREVARYFNLLYNKKEA
mmetsp:Transcript_1038/g.1586  ORF Transcript_1038/g.1586 Transcript_1038/m.1586 type:complete len:287 (-) Transcript_1038:1787-2647(-)